MSSRLRARVEAAVIALSIIAVAILAPSAAAVTFTVRAIDFAFVPSTVTITVGDQVTWINNGTVPHTVTWTKNRVGTRDLQPGSIYFETFNDPGTFLYECRFHPTQMQGTIIVVGVATPTPTPTPTPATPTPTPTPSPTAPPSPAPTPTPSPAPTVSPSPAPSPSPTASPSPTPSSTPSPTPALSPTRATPTPTRASPTPTATPTATPLTSGASGTNTTLGVVLVLAGLGVLGATLWWRFGRPV